MTCYEAYYVYLLKEVHTVTILNNRYRMLRLFMSLFCEIVNIELDEHTKVQTKQGLISQFINTITSIRYDTIRQVTVR